MDSSLKGSISKDISKDQKILIMGLNNSGKSTILLSLKGDTNLFSFTSIKATKGIDISEIKKDAETLHIWDFGGQEQFRIGYLKNLKRYSTQATRLVYVIDIQDTKRYNKTLRYLENIIEILDKSDIQISLSIFLHKFDPNLRKLKPKLVEKIDEELIPKIKMLIPSNWDHIIFNTTVFTVFQKTLRD